MLTRGEQLLIDRQHFALRTRKKAVTNKNKLTYKYEHEEALRLFGEEKTAAIERLNTLDSITERDARLLNLVWDAEGYVNVEEMLDPPVLRRVKVILRTETEG